MQNIFSPDPDSTFILKGNWKHPRLRKKQHKQTNKKTSRAPETVIKSQQMFLEKTASNAQSHPPLACSCLNSTDWWTDAVRKIKHSYANTIMISSPGSMSVGGGDGKREKNLAISFSTTTVSPVSEDRGQICVVSLQVHMELFSRSPSVLFIMLVNHLLLQYYCIGVCFPMLVAKRADQSWRAPKRLQVGSPRE